MENERWKDVVEYEGFYQVSSLGRVRSVDRKIKHKNNSHFNLYKGKVLRQGYSHGYMSCVLTKNSKKRTVRVHRLVTIAFIPNLEDKPMVNHINGIKDDNKVSNLEWCTDSENKLHAYSTGLCSPRISKKYNTGCRKLTKKQVIEIRYNYNIKKETFKDIGERYNVSRFAISDVINRRTWDNV